MPEQLCIIYEVPDLDESALIRSGYFPTKNEAVEAAKKAGRRVYKIRASDPGGIREAVCRIANQVGWIKSRELIEDYR